LYLLPRISKFGAFFIQQPLHLQKLNNSIMGRGDKKTAKGKRFLGSFGKSRPANPPKKKVAEKKKEA
jgi:30S ribosomal protein S31